MRRVDRDVQQATVKDSEESRTEKAGATSRNLCGHLHRSDKVIKTGNCCLSKEGM